MKTQLFLLSFFIGYCFVNAQTTYVPDDNFEQKLIDLGYDSGALDDYVLTANIDTITSLTLSHSFINSLVGIQDFTSLTILRCDSNYLTALDITQNAALTELYCNGNQLTNLNVTHNIALTNLTCNNNQLANLDVSQNIDLITLNGYNNQLADLDVSQNIDLINLNCNNNQLTNLDVMYNIALEKLSCESNQLTSINLTQNTNLIEFVCNYNQITSLDLSLSLNLNIFSAYDNQLNFLNIANGNNANFYVFDTRINPNLTCIEVDDPAYSNTSWTYVDPASSFNTDCSTASSNDFELNQSFSIYPNPVKDMLFIESKVDSSYQIYDRLGRFISKGNVLVGENNIILEELSNGVYFIRINSETKKIIKN